MIYLLSCSYAPYYMKLLLLCSYVLLLCIYNICWHYSYFLLHNNDNNNMYYKNMEGHLLLTEWINRQDINYSIWLDLNVN